MPVKKKEPGKPRKPTLRQEKLIEGVLQGKSRHRAALDAGYAESTARVDVYKILEKPSMQARIQARIRDARIDTNEVIGTLVSQMRGDLAYILPEHKVLKAAHESGVSHLIKEIEVTEQFIAGQEDGEPIKEVKTKIKIHDSQAAARQLCAVFGLNKAEAPNPADPEEVARRAAERFVERAKAIGQDITLEYALSLVTTVQSEAVH